MWWRTHRRLRHEGCVQLKVEPTRLNLTRSPRTGTVALMAETPAEQPADVAFIDERGVAITRSGLDRAHRRLAEAEARRNPEYWAQLRARLGLPARTA